MYKEKMCISPASKSKEFLVLFYKSKLSSSFKADACRKRNKYLEGELKHQNQLRQKHKRQVILTRPRDPLLSCDSELKQSSACVQKCGGLFVGLRCFFFRSEEQ